FGHADAVRGVVVGERDSVVGEASRGRARVHGLYLDAVQQRVGGGGAEGVAVAEHVQPAGGHGAAAGGAVMVEHHGQGLIQQLQVGAVDAGLLAAAGKVVQLDAIQP